MHDGLRDHQTRTEICPFRASLTLLACAMRTQLARLERFLKHGAALPLFGASGEIRLILTGRCGRSVWRSFGERNAIGWSNRPHRISELWKIHPRAWLEMMSEKIGIKRSGRLATRATHIDDVSRRFGCTHSPSAPRTQSPQLVLAPREHDFRPRNFRRGRRLTRRLRAPRASPRDQRRHLKSHPREPLDRYLHPPLRCHRSRSGRPGLRDRLRIRDRC